jgi:glycolate oxidase FAD binding subunit
MTRLPPNAIEECLHGTVGTPHLRAAAPDDAVHGIVPALIVEPGTEQEVADVLRAADDAGLAVIPRGGGTKLEWGNPPARADVVLSTARLNRVLAHAWSDLTATVEAGCVVAHLQETLAEHGQRLAIDPLWPERATIGGILSANDSGPLRLRYGGLRDLIIGVTLACADGTLAASGGRVVKNVAGYDLQKLATGALGTLGVITQATFRLHPLPKNARTLTLRVNRVEDLQRIMLAIQDSELAHTALQMRIGAAATPETDVLLDGTEAGLAAQEATIRQLAGDMTIAGADPGVWSARERLWEEAGERQYPAIAKLSMPPAEFGPISAAIARIAASKGTGWRAVVQASGIGWLRLDGASNEIAGLLTELRGLLESGGGSLVILRQPPGSELEAWGSPGDALPVMRALKHQLDPRGTLNPGRFVGGI